MIKIRGGAVKELAWQEDLTVSHLLKILEDPYPYAVVHLNGRTVTLPNFEKTFVPDEAEIFLIPMVVGG
ncbi:MAG: MoaD/ThiS family protein [Deltaproteobacteria bacterium]|nr:MoaD/ThiS family protein [Deltaproteobacteria bacterium]